MFFGVAAATLMTSYTTSSQRHTVTLRSTATVDRFRGINTRTSSTTERKGGGLSQSDKIAMGIGLGVGIPSLIFAALTLLRLILSSDRLI